jgi:RNA polymerase sigma factor (sigma-70 family)
VTRVPFQKIIDTHGEEIYRFLYSIVGPNDAEDCFQETFLSALRAYPDLRYENNLRAWLFTIARNKAIDNKRQEKRTYETFGQLCAVDTGISDDLRGVSDLDIWFLARRLPDKQRLALALRFVCDLSHRDIGRVLNISEDAARQNVAQGVKRLREAIAVSDVAANRS